MFSLQALKYMKLNSTQKGLDFIAKKKQIRGIIFRFNCRYSVPEFGKSKEETRIKFTNLFAIMIFVYDENKLIKYNCFPCF